MKQDESPESRPEAGGFQLEQLGILRYKIPLTVIMGRWAGIRDPNILAELSVTKEIHGHHEYHEFTESDTVIPTESSLEIQRMKTRWLLGNPKSGQSATGVRDSVWRISPSSGLCRQTCQPFVGLTLKGGGRSAPPKFAGTKKSQAVSGLLITN